MKGLLLVLITIFVSFDSYSCPLENLNLNIECKPSLENLGFKSFTGKLTSALTSPEPKDVCVYGITQWKSTYVIEGTEKTYDNLDDLGDLANYFYDSGIATWLPPALMQEPFLKTSTDEGSLDLLVFLGLDSLTDIKLFSDELHTLENQSTLIFQKTGLTTQLLDDTTFLDQKNISFISNEKKFYLVTGSNCSIQIK